MSDMDETDGSGNRASSFDTPEPRYAEPHAATRAQIDAYLSRRDEVVRSDHDAFQDYLREKQARAMADQMTAAQMLPPPGDTQPITVEPTKARLTRRGMFKAAAATALVAETGYLGYHAATSGVLGSVGIGAGAASASAAQAQSAPISRELIDSRSSFDGQGLGKWVALLPTKMGGGTYALDLNTNRVLASIWYWNYGDFNPISHHLCAFPSADPYHTFEFVNSTQGGKNSLIYGIPTNITEPGPGFNIYRVRYDGAQMQLMENVSETTGLGLGVHVCVNPGDAQSYFVTDGQKDIAACFTCEVVRSKQAAMSFCPSVTK